MKHVWVIICGCIGDEHIYKICSSEVKAKSEIKRMLADKWLKQTTPYYEKWIIE